MLHISRQRSFKIFVKEFFLGNVDDWRPGTSVKWAPSQTVFKAYIVDICYLEYLLPRTFTMLSNTVIFGLFLISYLEHSNEIFEWIILFISGIQMVVTVFTKLCREVCSFLFSTSFWQQHVKTQWKKFRQEMSGFERPTKSS